MENLDLQLILRNEYRKRKEQNPSYSLRQFAKRLSIPSGRLSEVISGKRPVTEGLALKIISGLDLDPSLSQTIVDVARLGTKAAQKPMRLVEDETFVAISDWYHYAILSLVETSQFRSDPEWIAERLGVDITLIRAAIERLLFIGLLKLEGKELKLGQITTETTSDLKSLALRKSHRQSLEQAINAIDDVPVELRDITSITMAINVGKLPLAKKIIKDFRKSLCDLLEKGTARHEVYNLNVQLVPVTKMANLRGKK